MTLIDKGQSESTQLANIWVTLESAHSALDTYDDEYDDVEARELMWHISEYMDSASRRLSIAVQMEMTKTEYQDGAGNWHTIPHENNR